VRDNFYAVGGDSLTAARIVAEVRAALGVELSLAQVLAHPTVELLAAEIGRAGSAPAERIEPAPPRPAHPLSPQQRRVLAEQARDPGATRYLLPVRIPLPENVDTDRLADALRTVVARHEILRTAFVEHDGEPSQRVLPEVEIGFGPARPFDLGRPPLLRAGVRDGRVLELDLHHIVTDGVSLGLLLGEVDTVYTGRSLPEVSLQYKDYATWLAGEAGDRLRAEQREYWVAALESPPRAELPTDTDRSPGLPDTGAVEVFDLGAERTERLRDLAAEEGVTLFTVLAAAYAVFLGAITGGEDIIFGTPVSGRGRPELETAQGMFVNTVCLRHRPAPELMFLDFLQEAAGTAAGAFAHQDFPVDELAAGPLFDTLFAVQHAELIELDFLGRTVELELAPTGAAMFDLDLQLYERRDSVVAEWSYRTALFRAETVRGFRDLFLLVLDRSAADPTAAISELTTVDERTMDDNTAPVVDFEF